MYVSHHRLTLEVIAFITYNQRTSLMFTKQATSTTYTFAMHGIVGKVNNNALLLWTVLY